PTPGGRVRPQLPWRCWRSCSSPATSSTTRPPTGQGRRHDHPDQRSAARAIPALRRRADPRRPRRPRHSQCGLGGAGSAPRARGSGGHHHLRLVRPRARPTPGSGHHPAARRPDRQGSSAVIHEVTSSLPRFKTLPFTQGLNILLPPRTEKSEQTDTRTGSGKSSLIEIFHHLLGGRADPKSMFRQRPLDEHWFAMTFDLAGRRVRVQRNGTTPAKVAVATLTDEGAVEDEETITNEQWKRRLAAHMFGLTEDGDWAPSFRACISYFLRPQSAGGFPSPVRPTSQQLTWDIQVNLSFL